MRAPALKAIAWVKAALLPATVRDPVAVPAAGAATLAGAVCAGSGRDAPVKAKVRSPATGSHDRLHTRIVSPLCRPQGFRTNAERQRGSHVVIMMLTSRDVQMPSRAQPLSNTLLG